MCIRDRYQRRVRGETVIAMWSRALVGSSALAAGGYYLRTQTQAQANAGPLPVVVTGPSGVGKGTLIHKLLAEAPDKVGFSVSHTTRGPRDGEVNGVDYHFVSKPEMEELIKDGEFVEYAHVHTNIYGTSKTAIRNVQSKNKICILDIDTQGAKSVKELGQAFPARFIFLAPPSLEELEARLRGRGTETEEKILVRTANAKTEVESTKIPGFWDKVLVNDDLAKASKAFNEFVLGGN
eukprot:TRINITY_DN5426_c0_g1_i1.p1 TRINITY_DN5426_c0_g1~~TRINITY_DN5426_c0_g1_i1.p1  ORF type:complete len:237 (+),score=74.63 TRINITY_DN5426_c0_g1_i1:137-847(+)